ncbi:VOC family protein [Flavilitoribacter nigricans]|uniref:Glyoxalase n=1 Tax=Flavilitoribacter nigricans (strain ATCC 23147 / DSM 23189 / NBRC 102662 / NCIMB 1420 / SS-2) TaxID=1122177 RepID=A0A2D0MZV3_FLAN2|nr:VOC family protein [Flavilitoribacter nigricans]PHN01658.1 glyoxalase [Flavilitoribacter nigricans DSM 23189 = NBRC 102662]
MKAKAFDIRTLDHVAIHVSELEKSAAWYQRVLGLERIQPTEWGPFPALMVAADGTGVALFPTHGDSPGRLPEGEVIRANHYAFRVDREDFESVKDHLKALDIKYDSQDHHFFHSIYIYDPDDHRVEITTQVRAFTEEKRARR